MREHLEVRSFDKSETISHETQVRYDLPIPEAHGPGMVRFIRSRLKGGLTYLLLLVAAQMTAVHQRPHIFLHIFWRFVSE